jgi:glutamine amidotransferase
MANKKIVIVDYNLSNLFSVKQACEYIGMSVRVSSNPKDIEMADAIILPGVGAFHTAMGNLESLGLLQPLKDSIVQGKPFFGICLGMQLLFSESEEFQSSKGLGFINGKIKKFKPTAQHYKVPQIAWNKIHSPENNKFKSSPLFGIKEGDYMYFVHSYYAFPDNKEVILAETLYNGITYCSGVLKNNIFAVQFHPEKSSKNGLEIYKNWALINNLK